MYVCVCKCSIVCAVCKIFQLNFPQKKKSILGPNPQRQFSHKVVWLNSLNKKVNSFIHALKKSFGFDYFFRQRKSHTINATVDSFVFPF